jgi:site-specific DNA-cytosine methylase
VSKIPFVDCQGLAGAWTLGTVQTGDFELVARRSLAPNPDKGGFGDEAINANRHLVGDGWEQQTGTEEDWEAVNGVGYVCGTPPCSGFSVLNTSKSANARGVDSKINVCMADLIRYSARCTGLDGIQGPEIVAFESVQQAYSAGRPLMQQLRSMLEARTGQRYALTHVKMSGSAVGNAQMRHRYYPVFHRIPFHVTTPEKRHVETYADAIGDLEGAALQREFQPYPNEGPGWAPAAYALDKRRDGITDHITVTTPRLIGLIEQLIEFWEPGEPMQKAMLRWSRANGGQKPALVRESAWLGVDAKYGPVKGWSWPYRIKPDQPGRVLTGAALVSFVHYSEPRLLTARECSRLMGYPDDWTWAPARTPMQMSLWIGKCCPVNSGRWISQQVADAIRGRYDEGIDQSLRATGDVTEVGSDEYLHDSTNVYKPWLKEQTQASA